MIIGADMLDNNMGAICFSRCAKTANRANYYFGCNIFYLILSELLLQHKYIFNSSSYVWNNILV